MDYKVLSLSEQEIQNAGYKRYLGGGAEFWEQRGRFQLILLKRLGLQSESTMLDVGCGPLRGGLHFIQYLGYGYCGVDANADFVSIGHSTLDRHGLSVHKGQISYIKDFDFSKFTKPFDFILCFSVLNHCSQDERETFLRNIKQVMHKKTKLIITHGDWLDNYPLDKSIYHLDASYTEGQLISPEELHEAGFLGPTPLPIYQLSIEQHYNQLSKSVFVCGCGHTGTSLLLAMLSNHSQTFGLKVETNCFKGSDGHERFIEYEQKAIVEGKKILIEKTPFHIYKIQNILEAVSCAKILITVRNPLDVIASLKKRTLDFEYSLNRYIMDNEEGLKYRLNKNVYAVKYENIMANTELEMTNVCKFIGIEFEKIMLEYYKNQDNYFNQTVAEETDGYGSNHEILRNWQMRQPISDKSGEWRKRITDKEYEIIKSRTYNLAHTLGYTFEEPYMLPASF